MSNTGGGPGFPAPQDFETYDPARSWAPPGGSSAAAAGANVDAVTLPGPTATGFGGTVR